MTIRYRTNDPARWGTGIGADLQPAYVDENFWTVDQRVVELEALPPPAAAIDHFEIVGDQMTVVMTDSSTLGPYTLPVVPLSFRGDWETTTAYAVNDMFQIGGSVYVTQVAHTSEATFDPGKQIDGEDVYALAFTVEGGLPAGGAGGMWLRKATSVDYQVEWATGPDTQPYDVAVFVPGGILRAVDTLLANYIVPRSLRMVAGLGGQGGAYLATAISGGADIELAIEKNGTDLIGTIFFGSGEVDSAGGQDGGISFAADVDFVSGDRVGIRVISSTDPAAADLSITLPAALTT